MPAKKKSGSAADSIAPSSCRHGGPRATGHIMESINVMINHSAFTVTQEEYDSAGGNDSDVQVILLKKMQTFYQQHPEAANEDTIRVLVAMAVDALLDANLNTARQFYQAVPFLRLFKDKGLEALGKSNCKSLEGAVGEVNAAVTAEGMFEALEKSVGDSCRCLSLYTPGVPLYVEPGVKQETYMDTLVSSITKIPVKKNNLYGLDSRIHIEMRRLGKVGQYSSSLAIIISPASRYTFNSFPVTEPKRDAAFLHILEGLAMGICTEGQGMIHEEERFRPALITTVDPLLAKFLSNALQGSGTRVSVASSGDRVRNGPDSTVKETPLVAIMDGLFADININVTKDEPKRKLPLGDTRVVDAKWTTKETGGKKKYKADAAEKRIIPERVMACKGCGSFFARSELKRCGQCTVAWYCTSECQMNDWNAGHKVDCAKKTPKKSNTKANQSDEDSGDDAEDAARADALDTFAVDLGGGLPKGSKKKTSGGKKGGKKGKKK